MSSRKGGLKKNLGDLLGDIGRDVLEQPELESLKEIDISRIQAGKYQPRRNFNELALNELAQSISEHGILQPLVVRPIAHEKYEIIAGERRFRAGQQAGLSKVPCVIKNYNDKQALAVALIENLQRADLNILEIAEGLQQLVKDFQLTHERVAQLIGRSRSAISNTLRLLELSEPVKKSLGAGEIEMGHARAMLSLNTAIQQKLLAEIKQKNMTVRQTESRVKVLLSGADDIKKEKASIKDTDILSLEDKISEFMGYSVAINHQKKEMER
ncbi:ParB/RepB/Spo0J family partition protein [Suttonella ornithocola]|uniref:Probable chromosome-partitioning protein ParB n=1 Tax=Suttonella ornithocola TaxID=279832 RepID=A0A380MTS9_9GAMM|nr:ParB/RepB/Spo0J family partition protein [Suttonella ornithocola]SUO96000.1 Probable chromosome-partitioning protein parB [Suttonella ornithocola]